MIHTSEDINTVLLPMAYDVKGCSCANEDGSYTIIINSRISESQRMEIYMHELRHIISGDFGCDDVDLTEAEAHRKGANYEDREKGR